VRFGLIPKLLGYSRDPNRVIAYTVRSRNIYSKSDLLSLSTPYINGPMTSDLVADLPVPGRSFSGFRTPGMTLGLCRICLRSSFYRLSQKRIVSRPEWFSQIAPAFFEVIAWFESSS
jgi:hypothetical protein